MAGGGLRMRLKSYGTVALNSIQADALAFRVDLAAGDLVANLSGFTAGSTPSISPSGKVVLSGSHAAGWKLLRGLTAVTAGSLDIVVTEVKPGYLTKTTTISLTITDLPTAGTLYLGALTPIGYGAAYGETYSGTGYLKVENASGNGQTKLRYNRRNQLVFAGTIPTGVPTDSDKATSLADSYTFDAVEYTDATYTTPTGFSAPRTLYTRGNYIRPAVTYSVGSLGRTHTLPALTIPLEKARFVTDWPKSLAIDPTSRYFNGDTLQASATNNQVVKVQGIANKLLGEWLVFCPGDHNMPYVDPAHPEGTVDFGIQPSAGVGNLTVNTLAAFLGTSTTFYNDSFADGDTSAESGSIMAEGLNWYNITMIDPLNTRYGWHDWQAGSDLFSQFIGCRFFSVRPSLVRGTFAKSTALSNTSGQIFYSGAPRYHRVIQFSCDFDDTPISVNGTSTTRIANGWFNKGPADTLAKQFFHVGVVDGLLGRVSYGVNPNGASLSTGITQFPGMHFTLARVGNTGEHTKDIVHTGNVFMKRFFDIDFYDRQFAGGVHPDHFQLTMGSSLSGEYPFGFARRIVMRPGLDNNDGSGQGLFLGTDIAGQWEVDGDIRNIIFLGRKLKAIATIGMKRMTIEHCTLLVDPTMAQLPDPKSVWTNIDHPSIQLQGTADDFGFVIRYNITTNESSIANDDNSDASGVIGAPAPYQVLVSNIGGVRPVTTHDSAGPINPTAVFAGVIYGAAANSVAAIKAAFTPKVGGIADKTIPIGALKTDGTWA